MAVHGLIERTFDSWLVPIAGFFLLPWTTLGYVWMWDSAARSRASSGSWSVSRSSSTSAAYVRGGRGRGD